MNLLGWDTAYAVRIDAANDALAAASANLIPGFQATVEGQLGTFRIDVVFGAWNIITGGGSGTLLNLAITFQSGTVTASSGATIDVDGAVALMQVSLALLPNPAANAHALMFSFRTAGVIGGPGGDGVVLPLGFQSNPPPQDIQALVLNAMAQALVGQAASLSFVFASINPVNPGSPTWLAPKNTGYAYFELGDPKVGYLAILSTAGSMDNLPRQCDPALVNGGASAAGFAFSIPLYFQNVVLPALVSVLPGHPSVLSVGTGAATTITQDPGTSIGIGSFKKGAITYYPQMKRFVATAQTNNLNIQASGDCDFYAGLSGSWSITANNAFAFDPQNATIGFSADPHPSAGYDIDIPWYWWMLGPVIYGICAAVVSLIAKGLANDLSRAIGGGLLPAAPPASVDFAGTSGFVVCSVQMQGAIVLNS